MLVLKRRINESIIIGDDSDIDNNAEITVLEVEGKNVILGITAPKSISIHRKEVFDAMQAQGKVFSLADK